MEVWQKKNTKTVFLLPVRLDNEREVPEEFEGLLYVNLYEKGGTQKLLEGLRRIVERQKPVT